MGRTRIYYIYEMNQAQKDKNVVSLTCRILKLTLEAEGRKLLTRGGGRRGERSTGKVNG